MPRIHEFPELRKQRRTQRHRLKLRLAAREIRFELAFNRLYGVRSLPHRQRPVLDDNLLRGGQPLLPQRHRAHCSFADGDVLAQCA